MKGRKRRRAGAAGKSSRWVFSGKLGVDIQSKHSCSKGKCQQSVMHKSICAGFNKFSAANYLPPCFPAAFFIFQFQVQLNFFPRLLNGCCCPILNPFFPPNVPTGCCAEIQLSQPAFSASSIAQMHKCTLYTVHCTLHTVHLPVQHLATLVSHLAKPLSGQTDTNRI